MYFCTINQQIEHILDMRQVVLYFLLAFSLLANAKIDEQKLFARIDDAIANQQHYKNAKERHIKLMKRNLSDAANDHERLQWLDSIYFDYSTYRYDSASVYVDKGLKLAESIGDTYYIIQNKINRATVLSVGGFYSQAESLLQSIDASKLQGKQLQYYYFTYAWLYNYWRAFAANSEFAADFLEKKKHYIQLTLQHFVPEKRQSGEYYYLLGELTYMDRPTHKDVLKYFLKSVKLTPLNVRVHAQAAYGLARYYKDMEQYDLYEEYLVEASMSDIVCQLKETLALQELATYIYKKDEKNSKRAAKYLTLSMEDAQFFNNRLRMLEISNILPVIAAANQQAAEKSRTRLQIYFIVLCVVLGITVVLTVTSIRRKNHLSKSRKVIAIKNKQLEELNGRLVATNTRRETYMRLFMDISALYIRKLDDYRKLVSRKVKTNQTADLLKPINSYKLAEEEAQAFYSRFDKAFMELYPDFVNELNNLLVDEARIELPSDHTLTTEIRIYALMRLGVTDSQEIATLLFYSTQTIYNYKSAMRAKAKNRDTFESDINRLCHLI